MSSYIDNTKMWDKDEENGDMENHSATGSHGVTVLVIVNS